MRHSLAVTAALAVLIAWGICGLSASPSARAEPPAKPNLDIPAQVRAMSGKVVRIDFEVDVDGRGPSAIGTRYLVDLLQAAGAKPYKTDGGRALGADHKKVQVLILGEIRGELTHARNNDDPLSVERARRFKKRFDDFPQLLAQRKAEAAAANVQLLLPNDLRSALGLTITHAQLLTESYRSMARAAAEKLPEVRLDKKPLADVLDFLCDLTDAPIEADWPALAAAGIDENAEITLKENDVPLLPVLREINAQCKNKLAIISDGARIRLTTMDDAKKRMTAKGSIWFPPEQWATVQIVQPELTKGQSALRQKIPTVHFDGIGLQTAIGFLKDVGGVSIDADWASLEAAGIASDAPLTMSHDDLTLAQVLDECAQAIGGGRAAFYASPDGVIHFTTTAKAEAAVKEIGGKAILIDSSVTR